MILEFFRGTMDLKTGKHLSVRNRRTVCPYTGDFQPNCGSERKPLFARELDSRRLSFFLKGNLDQGNRREMKKGSKAREAFGNDGVVGEIDWKDRIRGSGPH